jgi:hypothetical protein
MKYKITIVAGALILAGTFVTVGAASASPPSSATQSATPSADWPAPIIPPDPTVIPDAPKPALSSISDGRPLTDDEVTAYIAGDKGDFPKLDGVYVKRTTIDQILKYTDGVPAGFSSTDSVVLATGTGTFVPAFRHDDLTFSWGTIILDATTGGIMGAFSAPGDVPAAVIP